MSTLLNIWGKNLYEKVSLGGEENDEPGPSRAVNNSDITFNILTIVGLVIQTWD